MQYTSPLSILPINSTNTITKKEVTLAKRKLMAEFELLGSTTITLNKKELSRNDVLQLFDELEQTDDFSFHALVASDKNLLYFLENNQLAENKRFGLSGEKITLEFVEWISPYYTHSFKKCSLTYFRKDELNYFLTLMICPKYVTADDEYEMWQPISHHLQILEERLQTLNDTEKPKEEEEEIRKLTNMDLVRMLIKLPSNFFIEQISTYAFEMMRTSIMVFNKVNKQWGISIVENARMLPVNDETYKTLTDKEKEMNDIIAGVKASNGKSDSIWNSWRLIGVVIFVLLKIFGTCNNSSNNNSTFKNVPITFTDEQGNKYDNFEDFKNRKVSTANYEAILKSMLGSLEDETNETNPPSKFTIKTGTDVYASIWKKYLPKTEDAATTEKNNVLKDLTIEAKIGEKENFHQTINIINRSNQETIVFIANNDSVKSCFVNPKDSIDVQLINGTNKLFVYAGKGFNKNKNFTYNSFNATNETKNAKGVFSYVASENKKLIKQPIILKLSESTDLSNNFYKGKLLLTNTKNNNITTQVINGSNAVVVEGNRVSAY
jgi:hypothetical protein